jgi:hypothetical protein
MLIFVWALEQQGKRKFDAQDVFVPWTFPTKVFNKAKNGESSGSNTAETPTAKNSGKSIKSSPATVAPTESAPSSSSSASPPAEEGGKPKEEEKDVVYQRFYHVFVEGELNQLVEAAGGVKITEHGYDRDNWYVIATKE